MSVTLGSHLPETTLPDQDGQPLRLQDHIGDAPLVVFFYPAAFTANCTKEACAFRDQYEVFREHGAQVIGISGDDVATQKRFADQYRLSFPVLSDADGAVRGAWGVPKWFGILPGRVTYVADKAGVVRYIFKDRFDAYAHIQQAVAAVQELA